MSRMLDSAAGSCEMLRIILPLEVLPMVSCVVLLRVFLCVFLCVYGVRVMLSVQAASWNIRS